MRRATTMIFIAGWSGFLGVSAIVGMSAILAVAELGGAPFGHLAAEVDRTAAAIRGGGGMAVLAVMAETLGSLMTVGILAASAWLMQRDATADQADGERLAFVAFGAIGLICVTGGASPASILIAAGTPLGFGFVIAASVLAIVMDRLAEVEEPIDDEADFRAALTLIGRHMARDPSGRSQRFDGDKR